MFTNDAATLAALNANASRIIGDAGTVVESALKWSATGEGWSVVLSTRTAARLLFNAMMSSGSVTMGIDSQDRWFVLSLPAAN